MATIKHNLSVEDPTGSIKKRTAEAKELGQELDNITSKAKKASAAQAGGTAAARQNMEYGRGRGAMGATGAGARDFANEAQGLGGLVRLYATYAANVFAVSAAFRALSDAMDTTNMIRGLDQLGATTGVAMGSLSKRFAEASGGAISLRESMEATAKAMSSGMTQQQFLQLGDVAKKASQALGVSMPDAVSRLTRGITKLEPELLDELGIFTKVGKATEDYARSVGKSVDSLTDFEKRQAFANAVLKEGTDKFKDIDIPTNPYDKLLASLKNVTQGILELINKALTPLIDFLSKSPGALTAAIAGIAVLILRQALPIFTSYRAAMQKATKEVEKMAEAKADTARKALEIARAARAKEMAEELKNINDIKVARIDAAEAQLKTLSKRGLSKQVQTILDPLRPVSTITPQELAVLDRYGEKTTKVAGTYKALAAAIREAQQAEAAFQTQTAAAKAKIDAPAKFGTAAYARQEDLERARKQAASASLVGKVGETVSTVGTIAATKELVSGIKTEKLGLFRGGLAAISGAATIAAGTISNLGSILGKFLGWIGLAITAFEILDFAFSKNGKEVSAFGDQLSIAEDNVKAATLTYQKFNEKLLPQNIIASSQAITNLADSLKSTVDALEQADKKASGWDKFIDGFKTLYGGDLKSKFGESLANQVEAGLNSITDPKLRKEAESKLQELLKVDEFTAAAVEKAADKIDRSKIIGVGKEVASVFANVSQQSQKSATSLLAVQDGFKALDKSYQELSNSLLQSDPLSNFGRDLAQQGFKLAEVFKDPISGAAELRDLLTDVSKIKLLSPESQAILIENKQAFIDLSNQLTVFEKQVEDSNKRLLELRKAPGRNRAAIAQEEAKLGTARAGAQDISQQMQALSKTMSEASTASIIKGFSIIEAGFNRAVQQGILTQQKTLLDKLPKTPETLMMSAKLENKKIDLQIEQINQTERLIKEMELSRLSAERIQIENQRDAAMASTTETNLRAGISRTAEEKLKPITEREKLLKSTNISKDIAAGKLERTPESFTEMQRQMGTMAKIAELSNQKQLNLMNAQVEAVSAKYEIEGKNLDLDLKTLKAKQDQFKSSDMYRELTLEQQQALNDLYAQDERELQFQQATLQSRKDLEAATTIQVLATQNGWKDIIPLAEKAVATAEENLSKVTQTTSATQLAGKAETDRSNALAISAREFAKITIELERQNTLRAIQSQLDMDMLGLDKQKLDQQLAEYKITQDSYNQQLRSLELLQIEKERDNKLAAMQGDYLVKINGLLEEYQRSDAEGKALAQAKIVSASQAYEAQVGSINRVADATKKLKTEQENLTERQKGYDELFRNSFSNMADAIADFAMTGKLNFKDMVDSMIKDIIRLELRLQFQQIYMSMRGSFLSMFAADGAAFDTGGVQKFARGGAFTNQIVNEPVLFKFAQGTGMMGEAGPEAIMPLTRDSSGNLGVRSSSDGSGKVDIVINNYSGQQVQKQETMDNRGNRRVEVTIGDINAGEISRSGSASQRAVTATFGLPPQLIRR